MIANVYNALVKGDKLYIFLKDMNLLCSIDTLTQEFSIIGGIPDEQFLSAFLVGKILAYNNCLYLIPYNAKKAWKYNIDTSEWSVLFEISEYYVDNKKMPGSAVVQKFNQAYLYDSKIYMIGYRYPAIVVLDLKDNSLMYDFDAYRELLKYDSGINTFIRHDCCINDGILFAPCMMKNYILIYNLNKREGCWKKIGSDNVKYAGITHKDNKFFLVPYFNDEYVVWDGENYFFSKKFINSNNNLFLGAFCVNSKVVFPGGRNSKTVELDSDNNVVFIDDTYIYYDEIENDLIVKQYNDGQIQICNGKSKIAINIDIKDEIISYIKERKKDNVIDVMNILNENRCIDLQLFIEML